MDNAANLRASYEKGSRDDSGLEIERSEDASLVVLPTGLSSNALNRDGSLRFDISKRSSDRAGLVFDISPVPMTTLAFTYVRNKDTYEETKYGLQDASYDTYTGEVSISPGERWNVTGCYSREKNGSHQVNNGTSNFPTIDDFIIRLTDDVDTAGLVLPGPERRQPPRHRRLRSTDLSLVRHAQGCGLRASGSEARPLRLRLRTAGPRPSHTPSVSNPIPRQERQRLLESLSRIVLHTDSAGAASHA